MLGSSNNKSEQGLKTRNLELKSNISLGYVKSDQYYLSFLVSLGGGCLIETLSLVLQTLN